MRRQMSSFSRVTSTPGSAESSGRAANSHSHQSSMCLATTSSTAVTFRKLSLSYRVQGDASVWMYYTGAV